MTARTQTINHDLFVRRCVACGYDGALLRGGQAQRCARCGCDLRRRPARSYAEMEGLIGQPVTLEKPWRPGGREQRLIQRWLAFMFLVMCGLLVLVYLFAAAMP
jgi:hypothetical protein